MRTPLKIGDWTVYPQRNTIARDGASTKLEPKVMEVLCMLAERPGEVTTRDALFDRVWAGTVVTDDVLTRSISTLRKVFGDTPRNPAFIETIPKTGYRLIAPVTPLMSGDAVPRSVPVLNLSLEEPPVPALPVQAPPTRIGRWVGLGALLLAGLGAAWMFWVLTPPVAPVYQTKALTTLPGNEANPAFSPDGKQVAFTWNGGTDGNASDIYIQLVGTGPPLRLTDSPAYENAPVFSPDGQHVAFMRYTEAGCQVFQVSALGGPARRLASCAGNIYPDLAWSPDGTWLAFSHRNTREEAFGILLMRPDGQDQRRLTQPAATYWGDHDPAFSPDGRTLTFTRSLSEGIQDLYEIPLAQGPERRRTFDARNLVGHTWMPDGLRIVFASNRGGHWGLWTLSPGRTEPALLLSTGWRLHRPVWQPQGDGLAFEQWQSDTNLWAAPLSDPEAAPQAWTTATRWDLHPQFAPDGTRFAFTSNRTGFYEVWVADSAGRNPTQLTHFNSTFAGTPRWSPDGQHLVFDARPKGHADLYMISAAGGTLRQLMDHPADDLAGSFSQDGQWIYFASSRNGAWNVWKQPVAGGPAEQVTHQGGYAAFEAPDGKSIYYTKPTARGLWRMPLGDVSEAEEKIPIDLPIEDWGHWVVRPTGIYFIQRNPLALAHYGFATGEVTTLRPLPRRIPNMDAALTVSADEQWAMWGQVDQQAGDLMLALPQDR